jgi:hypothetical protein
MDYRYFVLKRETFLNFRRVDVEKRAVRRTQFLGKLLGLGSKIRVLESLRGSNTSKRVFGKHAFKEV